MEEPRKGQDPTSERGSPDDAPEPARPSIAPSIAPLSETEQKLIRDGQARAERDLEELQAHGFGHHIGSE